MSRLTTEQLIALLEFARTEELTRDVGADEADDAALAVSLRDEWAIDFADEIVGLALNGLFDDGAGDLTDRGRDYLGRLLAVPLTSMPLPEPPTP